MSEGRLEAIGRVQRESIQPEPQIVFLLEELSKWKSLCKELLSVARRLNPEEDVKMKWQDMVEQIKKDYEVIERVEKELSGE